MNINDTRKLLNNLSIAEKKNALLLDKVGDFELMRNFKSFEKYLNSLKFSSVHWKEINAKNDEEIERLHSILLDRLQGK